MANDNTDKKAREMFGKLSAEEQAKISNLLSDRQALEKLLSTPKAQELMKKLGEGVQHFVYKET